MNGLARCLLEIDYWESGSAYAYVREYNIQRYVGNALASLLKWMGLTRVTVVETPYNGPSIDPSTEARDVLGGICDSECLLFRRVTFQQPPPPSSEFESEGPDNLVFTSTKHIVDGRRYNGDFEGYLKSLSGHHRQTIRRFKRKLTSPASADGVAYDFSYIHPDDVFYFYEILRPLHEQVQRRNRGDKRDVFLKELLRRCADDASHFRCLVLHRHNVRLSAIDGSVQAKQPAKQEAQVRHGFGSGVRKEDIEGGDVIAFAILVEDMVPFTSVSASASASTSESQLSAIPQKTWFVPLVGNNADEGRAVMAYHNLLCRMVEDAIGAAAILDLGHGHYDVKKLFEPAVVPQYLEYIGNSSILRHLLQIYTKYGKYDGAPTLPSHRKNQS